MAFQPSVQRKMTIIAGAVVLFTTVAAFAAQQLKDGGILHRLNYEIQRDLGEYRLAAIESLYGKTVTLSPATRSTLLRDVAQAGADCADLTSGFGEVMLALSGTSDIRPVCQELSQQAGALVRMTPDVSADFQEKLQRLWATKDRLDQPIDALNSFIVYVALSLVWGIGLAIAVIIIAIARGISARFSELRDVLQSLVAGNLDIRIPMIRRTDEFGAFARSFEDFKHARQDAIRLEGEAEKQVAIQRQIEQETADKEATARAAQLAEQEARAEQQQQRATALASLVTDFDSRVAGALASLRDALRNLQNTAATLEGAAEVTESNSREASSLSAESRESTGEATAVAQDLSRSIGAVSHQQRTAAEVAAKAVEQLGETAATVNASVAEARAINDITVMINKIADQTNLLALNATIEAERAGNAGKGFAVVAREVKMLARQTSDATSDIDTKIESLRTINDQAEQAVGQVSDVVDHMNTLARETLSAMTEQSDATRQISDRMLSASSNAQRVDETLADNLERADDVRAASQDLRAALNGVSDLAQNLQQQVETFLGAVQKV